MALTNLRAFTLGVTGFAKKKEADVAKLTKKAGLRAVDGLVFGTRVDRGRARGNWQAQEGEPPEGYDPEKFDKTGNATVAAASRVILASSGKDIIWLHNGVPYIGILEQWDAMLRGNVEALRTWLRSQRL